MRSPVSGPRALVPAVMSLALALSFSLSTGAAAFARPGQQPPTPQPFPSPSSGSASRPASSTPATRTTAPPPTTATAPATAAPEQQTAPPSTRPAGPEAPAVAPTEAALGLPIYPESQFIASYNAGQGQRYYIFGTSASFAQVTAFYRGALKLKGDIVFDEPQTVMFEVGRYREETMAFPPGVTVKDYTWGDIGGYLNPKRGTQPERFPTVIQIVPSPGGQQ